jgi:glycosyltransferase involved in cell wall biosynthesis
LLRILVVSQYFWPESFRVNELVEQLSRRGHQVTVLTGRPNYPDGVVFDAYAAAPRDFAAYGGAEVLRVPLRPRGHGSLRLVLNYWSFVFWGCVLGPWLLRGRRFDAIFCFETSPITSALPAVLLRRIKRAPLALWVLDLWPDTLSAVGVLRSPAGLRWVGRLVAFIYRRCDLILAQSRAFFGPIERWSGDPSKTRYFPQWADGVFDGPAATDMPAELQPHAQAFRLMFAGNVGEAQDFPTILAAAAALRDRTDIHWLIVGDGRALPSVRADIERLGLEKTVFLLGRHPLQRMPSFFAAADAMLVTLKKEPIFAMTVPGKLQSYLAAGRPVIAMLDGEGADVVRAAGAGLSCAAGDAEGLARIVLEMSRVDPARREAMGRGGKGHAQTHFDRDTLIGTLEGWLSSLQRP